MSLGEVNKGVIALMVLLLVGAGGYLWYSQMYTPAVAARAAAKTAEQTAQGGLSAAKSELAAAQERIEQARTAAGKLDDSVGKVALASKAIPREQQIDDAAIVLMDLADRADISTTFKSPEGGETGMVEGGGAGGATPIDLEFEAAGTYAQMMLFMSLVEDTVVEKDGKLHTRDRLFNVVKLQIGASEDEEEGSGDFAGSGSGEAIGATGPIPERGDMLFTVTVRMYTSSNENAASVGASTPDAAAAPIEGDGTGEAGATGGTPEDAAGGPADSSGAGAIDDGTGGTGSPGEASGATGSGDTATSGAGPAAGGF